MSELKNLLEQALGDGHGPDPARSADPGPDLARGRRLRRRRRLGLTGTAVVAAAVAVAVPLSLSGAGQPGTAGTGAGHVAAPGHKVRVGHAPKAAHPKAAPHHAATAIKLVAYTGQQAPGYQVSEVPSGWVIQGGNPYVLTLAPRDDKNKSVDVFVGKLVVMLQSRDAKGPGPGRPQPVAGRPGRFDVQDGTQILTYKDSAGGWVVIQAPTSLGWNSGRLAQFAAGVQVLGNAQQGRG
jgi:hypothetical protein